MRILLQLLAGIVIFALAAAASPAADETSFPEPLTTRNQHPLIAAFGLPAATGAAMLPAGNTRIQLDVDTANSFVFETADGEYLAWDGETTRATLRLSHGIGNGAEVGLSIPVVAHSGGVLDGMIDGWHDTFGLPTGGREHRPNHQLLYRYIHDGRTRIDAADRTTGLGDLRIAAAYQLLKRADRSSLALHTALKFPTGKSADLTGSGGMDLSAHLAGAYRPLTKALPSLYGTGGLLWAGTGDLLPDQQRHVVFFGTVGIEWRPILGFTPKLQVDWHSPFFRDSLLKTVDSWSAQLVLGGTLPLSDTTFLDAALSEDIAVDTAPDIALHLSLRRRF